MALLIQADRSALVVIDFQTRLVPHMNGAADSVVNAQRLITAAETLAIPVVITEQYPNGLGKTIPELSSPTAVTVAKFSFGSCVTPEFMSAIGTDRDLILTGCEAHICVLQTALGLCEHGRRVYVVQDAIGSRRAESKQAALQRMAQHGVEIVTTEMVVFEWLRTSTHSNFKALSALIR